MLDNLKYYLFSPLKIEFSTTAATLLLTVAAFVTLSYLLIDIGVTVSTYILSGMVTTNYGGYLYGNIMG